MKKKYKITWNKQQLELLETFKYRCVIYAWMHKESITFYDYLNNGINILNIILTGLATAALFSTITLDNTMIIQITIGGFTAISTILSTISQTYNFSMTLEKHNLACTTYSIINNDICEKLITPDLSSDERVNFINIIKEKFNQLIITSPNIPRIILKKHIQNLDISKIINKLDKSEMIIDLPRDTVSISETPTVDFKTDSYVLQPAMNKKQKYNLPLYNNHNTITKSNEIVEVTNKDQQFTDLNKMYKKISSHSDTISQKQQYELTRLKNFIV